MKTRKKAVVIVLLIVGDWVVLLRSLERFGLFNRIESAGKLAKIRVSEGLD